MLRVLAEANVPVAAHVQTAGGVALVTQAAPRSAVDEAIGLLERDAAVQGPVVGLPVETLR